MKLALALIGAAAILGGVRSATSSKPVTRHEAKLRTFKALLAVTEESPDVADATKANVTVEQCRRIGSGWLCHGELAPVSFSGIDGSRCPEIVIVYARTTHVRESQCI